MRRVKTVCFAAAAVIVMSAAVAVYAEDNTYNYISPEELKSRIESDAPMTILDIQVKDEFSQHHIKGAVPAYAYPVRTAEEKARIDEVYAEFAALPDPVIIVCPRGGGGAMRTFDHLLDKGMPADRLFILEKGQGAWPYAELLEK